MPPPSHLLDNGEAGVLKDPEASELWPNAILSMFLVAREH